MAIIVHDILSDIILFGILYILIKFIWRNIKNRYTVIHHDFHEIVFAISRHFSSLRQAEFTNSNNLGGTPFWLPFYSTQDSGFTKRLPLELLAFD